MGGTVLQPAVDLEVAERESVGIAAALERDPCALADAAVRAVAADQVARPHLLAAPVPVAKRAGDLQLIGREGDQIHAALHLDAPFGQVLVQHRFGLGLRDEEQERVGGVLEPDVEQPDRHDPLAEVQPQLHGVVAALDQLLGDLERPQDLERARLHGKRTRLVHAVELAIDDSDAGAERVQLRGERQPGRTGANDQNTELPLERTCPARSFGGHACTILAGGWAVQLAEVATGSVSAPDRGCCSSAGRCPAGAVVLGARWVLRAASLSSIVDWR
jgi:hypothetical protein